MYICVMEDLIEQYLFQHNQCPLPSIGTLQLKDGSAIAWHGDNKLSAPVPHIELTGSENPADHFIGFIAARKKISREQASILLQQYCADLQMLTEHREMKLHHAGTFHIDTFGKLVFKQEAAPMEFLPSVPVQRVLHPKPASHTIRVGDTETTSVVMTEFYSDKGKRKKDFWWLWALALTAIAAAALSFYFRDHSAPDNFGNVQPVDTAPMHETYQTK